MATAYERWGYTPDRMVRVNEAMEKMDYYLGMRSRAQRLAAMMKTFASARCGRTEDGGWWVADAVGVIKDALDKAASGESTMTYAQFDDLPNPIANRVAVLLAAPVGYVADNIGRRVSEDIFWLYFEEDAALSLEEARDAAMAKHTAEVFGDMEQYSRNDQSK